MFFKEGQIILYNLPSFCKTSRTVENKVRPMLLLKKLYPLNGKEWMALPISSKVHLDIHDIIITPEDSGVEYTSVARLSRLQVIYEDAIEAITGDLKAKNPTKWNHIIEGTKKATLRNLESIR